MALLLRTLGRQSLLRHQGIFRKCVPVVCSSDSAFDEMKEFWATNRALKRPLSPHLSIYKPQLTSMLSLCHRVTGIAMMTTILGVSCTLLVAPGDFTAYFNVVKDLQLPAALIIGAKYVISFPITYHYINGIRHLAWDWAIGFSMEATYKSGYFVSALALLVCSGFVWMF